MQLGVVLCILRALTHSQTSSCPRMVAHAQDNYVHDSKGIQEKVFRLKRIIGRLDEKLVAHLEANDVEFLQFAFRWYRVSFRVGVA